MITCNVIWSDGTKTETSFELSEPLSAIERSLVNINAIVERYGLNANAIGMEIISVTPD